MSKEKTYLAVLAAELVFILAVMDMLYYVLPAPWFVGLALLIIALIGPINWTIEGCIFGEVNFEEDEP